MNRIIELQDTVEKQNSELTSTRTKLLELTNKCTELEESLTTTSKDLIKSQEQVVKLQRDLREVSFLDKTNPKKTPHIENTRLKKEGRKISEQHSNS